METTVTDPLEFGRQLRQPTGQHGISTGLLMNRSNRVMYDDMLKLLELKPGYHLLEIGFGNGLFLKDYFAAEQNLAVTGLDFSETMMQEASRENKDLLVAGKLNLVQADAANMPFEGALFDAVITINTLYFWANPETQLAEIKRVLKPGGQFLIGYRPKDAVKDAPFTKEVFTLYHPSEVQKMVEQAGFAIACESENWITVTTDAGKKINMPGKTLKAIKQVPDSLTGNGHGAQNY